MLYLKLLIRTKNKKNEFDPVPESLKKLHVVLLTDASPSEKHMLQWRGFFCLSGLYLCYIKYLSPELQCFQL